MKRIALLNSSGVCLSVALWDGVAAWNPVAAGLCASTVDVTARPDVGPGWSDSAGTWTAPASPAPAPDSKGFVLAVFTDASIPLATRLALVPWRSAIEDHIDNPALIAGAFAELAALYAISSANQATIHGYAVQYAIPGI